MPAERSLSDENAKKLHIGYDFLYSVLDNSNTDNHGPYAAFFLSRRTDPKYILFMQVLRTLDMKKDLASGGQIPTDSTGKAKLGAYNIAMIMGYGTEVADIASTTNLDDFFKIWIDFLKPPINANGVIGDRATSPIALKFGIEYAPIVEKINEIPSGDGLLDADKKEMHIVYQEAGISPHKLFTGTDDINNFPCDNLLNPNVPNYRTRVRIGLNVGSERFDSFDRSPKLQYYAPLHYAPQGYYFKLTKDYYRCYGFNGCEVTVTTSDIRPNGNGIYQLNLELDDVEGIVLEAYNQGNVNNNVSISKILRNTILNDLILLVQNGDNINTVVNKLRFYFQTKALGDANQSFMSDEQLDYIKTLWPGDIKNTMVTHDRTVIITNTSMRRNSTYFFNHSALMFTFTERFTLSNAKTSIINTIGSLQTTKKIIKEKAQMLINSKNIVNGTHKLLTDNRVKTLQTWMPTLQQYVTTNIDVVIDGLKELKRTIPTINDANDNNQTMIDHAQTRLEGYRQTIENDMLYTSFLKIEVSRKKKGRTRKYSIMWMKSAIWLEAYYPGINALFPQGGGSLAGSLAAQKNKRLRSRQRREAEQILTRKEIARQMHAGARLGFDSVYVNTLKKRTGYTDDELLRASLDRARRILVYITDITTLKSIPQSIEQSYEFAKQIITYNDFRLISGYALNEILRQEKNYIWDGFEPYVGGTFPDDSIVSCDHNAGIEILNEGGNSNYLDMSNKSYLHSVFEVIFEKALYLQETINILTTGVIETDNSGDTETCNLMMLEYADMIWGFPIPQEGGGYQLTGHIINNKSYKSGMEYKSKKYRKPKRNKTQNSKKRNKTKNRKKKSKSKRKTKK